MTAFIALMISLSLFLSMGTTATAQQTLAEFPVSLEAILIDKAGERIKIADIAMSEPVDGEAAFTVTMTEAPFSDHFLSMRPFKCIAGPEKHWCHVPYPYDIRGRVSADDLTDLEYQFLFVWKGATEYGIDLWNGVYYKLSLADAQIAGTLNEFDMNILAVPPEAGNMRPIRSVNLEEAEADSHWLPTLIIE